MTNKDYILKGVEFIENNLKENISVFDVSKKIGYSLFHFTRLFQGVTGFSPKSYLLQRRLSESANELVHSKKKVVEIAYDYQFGSPEAFSRAFRKQFGMKPMEVRKGKSLTTFPILNAITEESLKRSNAAKEYEPEIVVLPEILLMGMVTFMKETQSGKIITDLWYKFVNEIPQIKNRLIPEKYYQVQYWSSIQEMNGLFFLLAIEVENLDIIPPHLNAKKIPAAKYLHFVHRGFSNKVGYTYKYIYNQYLPKTDYKLTEPYNFEFYGDRYKGPYNEESESDIYIPIE